MALFGLLKKKPATGEMPPIETPRQEKTPEAAAAKPETGAVEMLQKNLAAGEAARAHTEKELTASRDLLKRHGADSPEINQKLEALTQKTEGLWGRFKKKMQDVADAIHTSLALGNASETDKAAYRTELKTAREQMAAEVAEGKQIFAETLPQAKIDVARAQKQKMYAAEAPANEPSDIHGEAGRVAEAADEDLTGNRDTSSGWFVGENAIAEAAAQNTQKISAAEQANFAPDKYVAPQFIDELVTGSHNLLKESENFAALGRSEKNFAAEEKRLQERLSNTERDIREIKENIANIDSKALRENRQKSPGELEAWHTLDVERRTKIDSYNLTVDQLNDAATKQEARRDIAKRITAQRAELQTSLAHLEAQKDTTPPALFAEKQKLISAEIQRLGKAIDSLTGDERGALIQETVSQLSTIKTAVERKKILETSVTQGVFESSGEEKNRRTAELLKRQAEAAATTNEALGAMSEAELHSYGDTLTRLGQGLQEILFQLKNNKRLKGDADVSGLSAFVDHVYTDDASTVAALDSKRTQKELFDNLPTGAAGRQELKKRATASLAEIQTKVEAVNTALHDKGVAENMTIEMEAEEASPEERAAEAKMQPPSPDEVVDTSPDVIQTEEISPEGERIITMEAEEASPEEKAASLETMPPSPDEVIDASSDIIQTEEITPEGEHTIAMEAEPESSIEKFERKIKVLTPAELAQNLQDVEAKIVKIDQALEGSTDAYANKLLEDDRLMFATERDMIRAEQEHQAEKKSAQSAAPEASDTIELSDADLEEVKEEPPAKPTAPSDEPRWVKVARSQKNKLSLDPTWDPNLKPLPGPELNPWTADEETPPAPKPAAKKPPKPPTTASRLAPPPRPRKQPPTLQA